MLPWAAGDRCEGMLQSLLPLCKAVTDELAVGMFCQELCGWEREVEMEMCEKYVWESAKKGANK